MDDYTEDLNTYSNNYTFLILDVKSPSHNIQDKLFWYKATIHPNLRLCADEAWIYNNKNYIFENPKDQEMYLQKYINVKYIISKIKNNKIIYNKIIHNFIYHLLLSSI